MLPKSLDCDSAEQSPVPQMAKALFNDCLAGAFGLYTPVPFLLLVGSDKKC